MAKKRKKKLTKRQQSERAWNKEVKRIIRWASKLSTEGFEVDFADFDFSVPSRITQSKFAALKATRGSKLYSTFNVTIAYPMTEAQAEAMHTLNIPVGHRVSYQESRKYRAAQRAATGGEHDPDYDAWEEAYQRCLEALSRGTTPEAYRAYLIVASQHENTAAKRRIFEAEDRIINDCYILSYDSKQVDREMALSDIVSIALGSSLTLAQAEALTPQ